MTMGNLVGFIIHRFTRCHLMQPRHTSPVTQLATAAWAGSLDSSSKELALPGSSRLRESQCTEGTVRITGIAAGTSLNLRVSPSNVAAGPLFAPAGVSVVTLTVFPTQSRGSDQLRSPPFGENTRTRLGDSRVGSVFGAPGDGGSTAGRFQEHGSDQYGKDGCDPPTVALEDRTGGEEHCVSLPVPAPSNIYVKYT